MAFLKGRIEMDNIITGIFGITVFLLFVGGLAVSIGHIPFFVIVIIVAALAAYGLYEDFRSSRDTTE